MAISIGFTRFARPAVRLYLPRHGRGRASLASPGPRSDFLQSISLPRPGGPAGRSKTPLASASLGRAAVRR